MFQIFYNTSVIIGINNCINNELKDNIKRTQYVTDILWKKTSASS